nr:cyclinB [Flammulina velutipes]
MASNARIPQRTRLPQRGAKADENAISRHMRQQSLGAASRLAHKETSSVRLVNARPALGEVTLKAVNRKDNIGKSVSGVDKDEPPLRTIRTINNAIPLPRPSLGPARASLAPAIPNLVNARAPQHSQAARRVHRVPPPTVVVYEDIDEAEEAAMEEDHMEVEDEVRVTESHRYEEEEAVMNFEGEKEVEAMVIVEDSDEEEVEEECMRRDAEDEYIWPDAPSRKRLRYAQEVAAIREVFEDDPDYDPAMVSEYADDIFEYMQDLEEDVMPNPDYMDAQNEISWEMRQTLVDWLLQAHLRYHMIPETVWIAVNIVDRFLSKRVVSLAKLQLVGIAALFIAAKYEEIMAPSVDEFVALAEDGYSREEVLKGERIILQSLGFHISHYCSPYSWMRKISRADDYDLQTRTLCKFLTEVTLLDYRFLRAKPSLIAAVGMYSSRMMLGGDWDEAFVFHSGYTAEQLAPGHALLVEKLTEKGFSRQYLVKKYANKKFLKASTFAIRWARSVVDGTGCGPVSMLGDEQL